MAHYIAGEEKLSSVRKTTIQRAQRFNKRVVKEGLASIATGVLFSQFHYMLELNHIVRLDGKDSSFMDTRKVTSTEV
jgi:hypothetical protein